MLDSHLYEYLAQGNAEQAITQQYKEHVLAVAQEVSNGENAQGVCITGGLPCVICVVFPQKT